MATVPHPYPKKPSLAETHPEIAAQWHPDNPVRPTDVTFGSNKKAQWVCSEGHEWESTVYHRSRGTGCPYCSGKKAIRGVNDLTTTHPALAAQWHPTRNAVTPQDNSPGQNRKER